MKIEIQQLSEAKKKVIVDCLRLIGGQINFSETVPSHYCLDIAREIEHGDLLLSRINYPQQEKEEQP